MVTVTADTNEVDALFKDAPTRLRTATIRSLNRGIVSGQTLMGKLIAEDTGLKVSDVKAAFTLEQATDARASASLSAGLKRIPLIRFNASGPEPSRGRRGGRVSYRLQGQKVFALQTNAFIATMQTGHRGVFVRRGSSSRKSSGAWSKNLPIKELFGPSIGHVFIRFQDQGQARAEESFLANLEHELGRMGFDAQGGELPDENDGTD